MVDTIKTAAGAEFATRLNMFYDNSQSDVSAGPVRLPFTQPEMDSLVEAARTSAAFSCLAVPDRDYYADVNTALTSLQARAKLEDNGGGTVQLLELRRRIADGWMTEHSPLSR